MFHFRKTIDSTSGSMVPRLVPEISPLDAFCDGGGAAGAAAGIGDSRSLISFLGISRLSKCNKTFNY